MHYGSSSGSTCGSSLKQIHPLQRHGELVIRLVNEGRVPEQVEVDKVQPATRMQMFRWDNEQQREHERKRAAGGKKTEYRLSRHDGVFIEVSKTMHDFAAQLLAEKGVAHGH